MKAKDLIELLQHVSPDTEVLALTPEKHLSSLLSVWEAYPYGRHSLQIVGVGERLCNTYKVQYVEDDQKRIKKGEKRQGDEARESED